MIRTITLITAARAEALFTSALPTGAKLSLEQAAEEIRTAVLQFGGTRGCAAEVAAAYGEHPETASARMRWARQVVEALYPPRIWPPEAARLTRVVSQAAARQAADTASGTAGTEGAGPALPGAVA
jgi:hypothetical protein